MIPQKHSPLRLNRMGPKRDCRAVVVGVSAGGLSALNLLLPSLHEGFPLPILIVQHRLPGNDPYLEESLNQHSAVTVKQADEKESVRSGHVYIAPANYHLLVERDETLSLSIGPKENFSRPAIDVLFESAAYAWSEKLIGIILTGANSDGAKGMELIKRRGGITVVQDPQTAEHDTMPKAAIAAASPDFILPLPDITLLLKEFSKSFCPVSLECNL